MLGKLKSSTAECSVREEPCNKLQKREQEQKKIYLERRNEMKKQQDGRSQQLSKIEKRKTIQKVQKEKRKESEISSEDRTPTTENSRQKPGTKMTVNADCVGHLAEVRHKTCKKSPRMASDKSGCKHYGLLEMRFMEKKRCSLLLRTGKIHGWETLQRLQEGAAGVWRDVFLQRRLEGKHM